MVTSVGKSVLVTFVALAQVSATIVSKDMGSVSVRAAQPVTQSVNLSGLPNFPAFSLAFGRDYSLQSKSCSGSACSVVIAFNPQFPGLSEDALLVKDTSGNLVSTTLLYGIGSGAQASFRPGVISTYAGSGNWGYSADGVPATAANLAAPQGVAIDRAGNLYVADSVNQVVRKVDANGLISTVAGTPGVAGETGDGGLATAAELNAPVAVALDGAGNLYIADSSGNCIRKVNAVSGVITTVAGGGTSASGVGDGGPATAAILLVPSDICVSPQGELYIADTDHGLVRKVDVSGTIWTVAGGGSGGGSDGFGDDGPAVNASLATPSGLAVNRMGDLYIADTRHNLVRLVVAGTISAFVATPSPYGVRLDAAGDLFISDYNNSVIRELPSASSTPSIIAGLNGQAGYGGDNGSPLLAQIANPTAITSDAIGNLYIADYANNRIRKLSFALQNMNFAATYAGQSSVAQTESLFNTGNQSLALSAITMGAPFTQQSSGGSDCVVNASITEGTNCVLSLALTASTPGSFNGALSITTNSLNQSGTTVAAALAGTALAATGSVQASPVQLAFGHQGVGVTSAAQTVTVTNTGAIALTEQTIAMTGTNASAFAFSNIQCGQTLNTGSQCTVQVTFTPTTPGGNTATITFAYAGASAVTVAITGTGDPAQTTISPAALDFGTGGQGVTSAAQTVTISNPSNAVLSMGSVSLSDAADFAINGTTCGVSLAPSQSCTVSVSFIPSAPGVLTGSLLITDSAGSPPSVSLSGTALAALEFIPMKPCRVIDTRKPNGSWGGPSITAQTSRDFPIATSPCDVPSTAAAYSFNLTVVPHGSLGYVTLWPTGQSRPNVSNINSLDGRIKAGAAIIPAGTNSSISAFGSNTTDIALDINGYFVPKGTPNALAFFPIAPCRVADTRSATGPLGGPRLTSGTPRDFPILASACNVPSSVKAYSLNFAAVPGKKLGYLTTWAADQAQPSTSTLNAVTGAVTSNATIAPAAANGDIAVFASDDTHVVIDINGYFAPAGTAGYSYFNLTPCRVLDTRLNGGLPVPNDLTIHIAGGSCGAPQARAYALNATVVPSGTLGYITLWPYDEGQPIVSTLNAGDGAVTSNLALVPSNQGAINFFGSDPTHILVDVFGFFQ